MKKLRHNLKSALYASTALVLMLFFQSCEFIDEKPPGSNIDEPTERELELIVCWHSIETEPEARLQYKTLLITVQPYIRQSV